MTGKHVSLCRLRTFKDIARFLPKSRQGKIVHVSTLHRWRLRGKQGVFLRCVRTPSGWKTSLDFVHEFFDRLTEVSKPGIDGSRQPSPIKEEVRQRRVEEELKAMGL